jgi:hypothetical protein
MRFCFNEFEEFIKVVYSTGVLVCVIVDFLLSSPDFVRDEIRHLQIGFAISTNPTFVRSSV